LILSGGLLAFLVTSNPALAKRGAYRAPKAAAKRTAAKTPPTSSHPTVTRHIVQRGQTLSGILRSRGVPSREVARWDAALRRAAGRIILVPGRPLVLHFSRAGRLATLTYEINETNRITAERAGTAIRARTEPLAVKTSVTGAQGVVERTFHEAARRAGVPDRIISQMADVLGWEFDFRHVQRGDRFRLVYERRISPDGRVLTPGKVLAAEIRAARRSVQAFYYDDQGERGYVDARGRKLSHTFLRYPVEFTRVSSVFSGGRFHPVLKKRRPHNGVDFSAPIGTPVRAAGDGVVRLAGRNGDYGVQIAVDHGDRTVTTYSHLRGVAPGVRAGRAVRQGQMIGWVGRTGLTTGPHLHFALFRNRRYVNPLTARVAMKSTVRDPQRFAVVKERLLAQLANLPLPTAGEPVEPMALAGLAPWHRLGVVTFTR
jgi:murein DD-endopeptidase MepM/ murein hydrolase activator NlpD